MKTSETVVSNNNRITAAIERQRINIADRIKKGLTTKAKVNQMHSDLDLDIEEFCKFQETKSLAFAMNKMTLAEASTLYNLLGTVPTVFNAQPIEVKVVLTQVFSELLEWQLSR